MLRATCVSDALISMAYSPIPIKPGEKRPAIERWQQYCEVVASPQQLEEWAATIPGHGYGIACGRVIAVDIDSDDEGVLRCVGNVLPATRVGKRGSKGWTLFYQNPHGEPTARINDRPGKQAQRLVDVLGRGAQTVIPPTMHPKTGRPYTWGGEATLLNTPLHALPVFPAGGVELIRQALIAAGFVQPQEARTARVAPQAFIAPAQVGTRLRAWAIEALTRGTDELAGVPPGNRNDSLFRAVCSLGRYVHHGVLSSAELEGALASACHRNGLISVSQRGVTDDREFQRTLKEGLRRSEGDALPVLEDRPHPLLRDNPAPRFDPQTSGGVLPQAADGLTIAELDKLNLPVPEFIVEDMLAPGCTLLMGKPKKGKSLMALQLANAVATGGLFLGKQCKKGRAIYYALEENQRRLQDRHRKLRFANMEHTPTPDLRVFTMENNVSPMDGGLIDNLRKRSQEDASLRLIVIDILDMVRPAKQAKEDIRLHDRRSVLPFTQLAAEFPRLAIMLVHHLRKAGSDDPFDMAARTLGLTGASDANFILASNDDGETMTVHGTAVMSSALRLQSSFSIQLGSLRKMFRLSVMSHKGSRNYSTAPGSIGSRKK